MITEEYFKSKIDWKFFNYIKDRCVKLEDMGMYVHFYVRVYYMEKDFTAKIIQGQHSYLDIYHDYPEKKNQGYGSYRTEMAKAYDNHGLFYVLDIFGSEHEEVWTPRQAAEKLCANIQTKAELLDEKQLKGGIVILKPKFS